MPRLLGIGLLMTCLAVPVVADSDRQTIERSGKLVVISFPHQANQFISPDLDKLRASGRSLAELHDGSAYQGIDVEILRVVATHLGVELEIRPVLTNYSDLIPALLRGDGQVIASGLTVTPSRASQVAFSDPYLESWIVAAAHPGSAIRNLQDLDGLRGAAMRGSSQLELLRALGLPNLRIVETDYLIEVGAAVEEGDADFGVFDSWNELGQPVHPEIRKLEVALRLRPFGYAFALRPDSDLLEPLNTVIGQLRESGEMEHILARRLYRYQQPKLDR